MPKRSHFFKTTDHLIRNQRARQHQGDNKQERRFTKALAPKPSAFGQPSPMDALSWQVYADCWEAMQQEIGQISSASKRTSSPLPTSHSQQLTALMMMVLLFNLPQVAADSQQNEEQNLMLHKDGLRTRIPKDDMSHFFIDLNLNEREKFLFTEPKVIKAGQANLLLLMAMDKGKAQVAYELVKNYDIKWNYIGQGGNNLLHHAARSCPQIISALVEEGVDPEALNVVGYTPLHIAAFEGQTKSVLNLLDAGANINVINLSPSTPEQTVTPLTIAIDNEHLEIVDILIQHGADLLYTDYRGYYPIHIAAHYGHIDIVERLCRAGVDINLRTKNEEGDTVLHLLLSVNSPSLDGIRRVIALGADRNAKSSDGKNSYDLAQGDQSILALLGNPPAPENSQNPEQQIQIHKGDLSQYAEGILDLVKQAVDPEAVDVADGYTLLHMAVAEGDTKRVLDLLDAGANINAITSYAKPLTPLIFAISKRHLEIIDILIQRGADLYKGYGRYPIHIAADYGYIDIVERLHRAGVDINLKTKKGFTVLHILLSNKNLDGIRRVIALGADVSLRDSDNIRPLYYAIWNQDIEIIKELLNHGVIQSEDSDILNNIVGQKKNSVSPQIIRLLCDYVSLHMVTANKSTPLMLAANVGNVAYVEVLLQEELNKHSPVTEEIYQFRVRAFHVAIMEKHAEVIKVFLKHDPTIRNAKSIGGRTGYDIAGNDQAILALLDNPPTPENSQDQEQKTQGSQASPYLTLIAGGMVLVPLWGTYRLFLKTWAEKWLGAKVARVLNAKKNELKTTDVADSSNDKIILLNELISFLPGVQVSEVKKGDYQADFNDSVNFDIDKESNLQLTAFNQAIREKYRIMGDSITIPNKLLRKYLAESLINCVETPSSKSSKVDLDRVTSEKGQLQEKILENSNEYKELIQQQQLQQGLRTDLGLLAQEISKLKNELVANNQLVEELEKELKAAKDSAQQRRKEYREDSKVVKLANEIESLENRYQNEMSSLQETYDNIVEQYQTLQATETNQKTSKELAELIEQINSIDDQLKKCKKKLVEFKPGVNSAKDSLEGKNKKLKNTIDHSSIKPPINEIAPPIAQPAAQLAPVPAPVPALPIAPPVLGRQQQIGKRAKGKEAVAPNRVENEEQKREFEIFLNALPPKKVEIPSKANRGKGKAVIEDPSPSASSSSSAAFFKPAAEQQKVSIHSTLSAEELRDQALIYANNITAYLNRISVESAIEQAIFCNALTYNLARLFVCLWELSLKTGAAPIAEGEQRKWRHFFAHLADKADVNFLTGLALELKTGSLANNNNISPEALLQHFQDRELNSTEFYRYLEREWNNYPKQNPNNNNNYEEVVMFCDASECLKQMQSLAQQFIEISEDKKSAVTIDDRRNAMKMLLAKIGENAALLRDYYADVWKKLDSCDLVGNLITVAHLITVRNTVFHEVEKIDITDKQLRGFKDSMPVVIDLLKAVQNEMAQIAESSFDRR